jgi:hypothetical protein
MKIQFTKYFYAYVLAIMGVIMCNVGGPYPILYGFIGGWFIGSGLKLAREYGEEKNSKK